MANVEESESFHGAILGAALLFFALNLGFGCVFGLFSTSRRLVHRNIILFMTVLSQVLGIVARAMAITASEHHEKSRFRDCTTAVVVQYISSLLSSTLLISGLSGMKIYLLLHNILPTTTRVILCGLAVFRLGTIGIMLYAWITPFLTDQLIEHCLKSDSMIRRADSVSGFLQTCEVLIFTFAFFRVFQITRNTRQALAVHASILSNNNGRRNLTAMLLSHSPSYVVAWARREFVLSLILCVVYGGVMITSLALPELKQQEDLFLIPWGFASLFAVHGSHTIEREKEYPSNPYTSSHAEIEPVHNETPEDYDWTKDVAKLGAYTLGSSYDNLLCSDIDLNDFAVIS